MTEIFLDKQVFKETYVPEKILHRDEPISKMMRILGDFERNATPSPMLVIGDFGTGKTAALRSICRSPPPDVKAVFVNCSEVNTQTKVFTEVLEQLGVTVKTGFRGDYYLRLFKAALPPKLILVLDEVDKLIEHRDSEYVELFYTMTRTISTSKVAIVMLTNKFSLENFLKHELDPKVRETLRPERIEFPDYLAPELRDILQDRARVGFRPGTYDGTYQGAPDPLAITSRIASIVYEHGLRARGLMELARKTGETAEANDHQRITEEDVAVASVEILNEQGLEVINHLPLNRRIILANILLKSPTIQDAYDSFKANPLRKGVSMGTFYGYITELEVFGVVDKRKTGRGRGKGVFSRLTVPSDLTSVVANSLQDPSLPSAANVTQTPTTYRFTTQ
jgi:cell division control protein 6